MEPFKSLTLLMSQNISLSPMYVYVLVFVRDSLVETNRKLKEMGDVQTDLSRAISLVDE